MEKRSEERSFISNKLLLSPTTTALKCCHGNKEKRKLNLFWDDTAGCNCVTANFNMLCFKSML